MTKTYTNKTGLMYEIIGKPFGSSRKKKVVVRFSDGFEKEADYSNALAGSVRHSGHYLYVGDTFKNSRGCEFMITNQVGQSKFEIKFLDASGYTKWVGSKDIKTGNIKNPFYPEVCGVGYLGVGEYPSQIYDENGKKKNSKAYEVWRGIMRRCYSSDHQDKKCPAYKGCFVNLVWHNFQNFAYWFYNHPLRKEGWHVDKDIISQGNKEYSPLLCTFVPTQINSTTTNSRAKRGEYPVGVYKRKRNGRFVAQLAIFGGTQKMLIETEDLNLAFNTYKEAKENYLKELAEIWKDQIDPLVYKGLYNWKVSEDD